MPDMKTLSCLAFMIVIAPKTWAIVLHSLFLLAVFPVDQINPYTGQISSGSMNPGDLLDMMSDEQEESADTPSQNKLEQPDVIRFLQEYDDFEPVSG